MVLILSMLALTACSSIEVQKADVSYVARPMANGPRVTFLQERSDVAFEVRRGYEAPGSLTLLAGKLYDSYTHGRAFMPQVGWTAGPTAGPIMGFQYEGGRKFLSAYSSYGLKNRQGRFVLDGAWSALDLRGVPLGVAGYLESGSGKQTSLLGPSITPQVEMGDSGMCLYFHSWVVPHSLTRFQPYAVLGLKDC